jgi:hypothetical protein
MIYCWGVVNGCFKYNSHSYLKENLWGWGNIVSFPRDGKSSLARKASLRSTNVILTTLVCYGFLNEIDPVMPSTWLSIYARCQILVEQGVVKVRLLHSPTKKVSEQAVVWKHIVSLIGAHRVVCIIGYTLTSLTSCMWQPKFTWY